MKSNPWGLITWTLFHTLIEKMPEQKYALLSLQLLNMIKGICTVLPCPDCSEHATKFLRGIHIKQLPTKEHFKLFFHQFHNYVNKNTKKPIQPVSVLDKYKNGNLKVILRNIHIIFNKNYGNSRMMMYAVKRKDILTKLYNFVNTHY